MSSIVDLSHNYKLIRDRLQRPPNAVKDIGIDLKRIPPSSCSVPVLEDGCRVYVREVPRLPIEERSVKISLVIKGTCNHFHIPVEALKGRSRKGCYTLPRHIAFYLAWRHTALSLPQIGRRMGGFDHTTVLHGRNKIREMMLIDDTLASAVKRIEQVIFYEASRHNADATVASVSQSPVAEQGKESLSRPQIYPVDNSCGVDREVEKA